MVRSQKGGLYVLDNKQLEEVPNNPDNITLHVESATALFKELDEFLRKDPVHSRTLTWVFFSKKLKEQGIDLDKHIGKYLLIFSNRQKLYSTTAYYIKGERSMPKMGGKYYAHKSRKYRKHRKYLRSRKTRRN